MTTPLSDVWTQLDLCTDCLHAVEYHDDSELGFLPGTLSLYRLAMTENGIDPSACHGSTYRLSSGEWESVPSTAFSTSPCHGCGSTLAGERHPYDYLPITD